MTQFRCYILLQLTKPDLLIMSQMSNKFRGRFSRAGQSHQRPKLLLPLHCHSLMILPLWNLEKAALQPALHLLSRQKEGVGPMAKGKYQLCLFSFTELTGSLVQWNPLTSLLTSTVTYCLLYSSCTWGWEKNKINKPYIISCFGGHVVTLNTVGILIENILKRILCLLSLKLMGLWRMKINEHLLKTYCICGCCFGSFWGHYLI